MTSAQVVETSVNVISNSPSQDYTHPDDRTLLYDMTPGFKPFTIIIIIIRLSLYHQIYEFLKVTFKNLLSYHLLCFVALARAISSHEAYCHIYFN